jgi:hypothetical protein
MRDRSLLGALLLIGLVLPVTSCSTDPSLTSITVNPGTVTTSQTEGLQVYFTAIGYYTHPGHTAVTKDLTSEVTWSTSWPQFVTIDSNGIATVTGYGYGTGSIYASAPGFHGDIVGSATFNIQQPTTSSGSAVRLSLYPSTQSSSKGTVQFDAVGTDAQGQTVRLTGPISWVSTDNQVASIGKNTGALTELGLGRTTITAVYQNPDGTTAVGKVTFNVSEAK